MNIIKPVEKSADSKTEKERRGIDKEETEMNEANIRIKREQRKKRKNKKKGKREIPELLERKTNDTRIHPYGTHGPPFGVQ